MDWKEGVLTIRQTKFAKSRLVPLHHTMLEALRRFVRHRDCFFTKVRPHLKPQRLFVKRSTVYSFWVSPNGNGASHGFVAADGPGFTGTRDMVGNSATK